MIYSYCLFRKISKLVVFLLFLDIESTSSSSDKSHNSEKQRKKKSEKSKKSNEKPKKKKGSSKKKKSKKPSPYGNDTDYKQYWLSIAGFALVGFLLKKSVQSQLIVAISFWIYLFWFTLRFDKIIGS